MSEPDAGSTLQALDLTNCDREPIHILGQVQGFGCLVAVSSDWMIVHVSVNCRDMLGFDPGDLIGKRFVDQFPEQTAHHLRTRLQILSQQNGAVRIFCYDVFGDGRLFDISIHSADRHLVFEFEPRSHAPLQRGDAALVQALIARVQRHTDVDKAAQEATRGLQALIGMDRVMVYRFEKDGCGTVIAETLVGNGEPYLGLRYPASDIPKQARELYKRSLLRIISDVDGEVFPIVPEKNADGGPLDLSLAVTRAVSPVHLEYLRNMDVGASLSVSIMRRGELWGLFACHHATSFHIDYERRSAVELFVQLFNYELAQLESNRELEDVDKTRALHDRLMQQVSGGATLLDMFDSVAAEIEHVIPFDGIAVYSNGRYQSRGSAPTQEEFLGLGRFLNTVQSSEVFTIDSIGARYEKAGGFADRAAGMLALPISRTPRDYLVLFRREIVHSVSWAGNPEKPAELGPNGIRLTPRKSFAAWQEVVRGKSAPWKTSEKRAADVLRVTLLEVVLKLADEASASRKRAEEQQELLIAELNHRVRNILNLIRSLVSQGQGDAVTVEEYSKVLDFRIHALARAHNQLTQQEWGWVSLKSLIRTEAEAFLSNNADRVKISGDDITLSPTAFTTMALVVHELVTNSAKYGALSVGAGVVNIDLLLDKDGSALVTWRESGGPPVQPPKRRGFGTTIIERSVPFELKGHADTQYKLTGFEARFMLPSVHVEKISRPEVSLVSTNTRSNVSDARLYGDALIVEDSMIIAMDASDMLAELGADKVHTASRISDALRILQSNEIAFALLDVNLGEETSLVVAQGCVDRGIPTVLATGYDTDGGLLSEFPKIKTIRKPYTIEQVRQAVLEQSGISS